MSVRADEMNMETLGAAVRRLHDLLPLKERQQSLARPHLEVHRAILQSLLDHGRAPTQADIAKILDGNETAAASAVALLGGYDLIVRNDLTVIDAVTGDTVILDASGGQPVGAYPFTTEVTSYRVTVNGHQVYAMCAIDALAVGPMFNVEVEIDSTCAVTQEPIHIRQMGKEILEAEPSHEIRVGVRWQRPSASAARTLCRQMVFLKDAEAAARWQSIDPVTMELFTLPEAVAFGDAFFRPLMED